MNVGFLFNSDHPALGSYYGPPVMDLILGTATLQNEERSMRVSVGDILTFSAAAQSATPTYDFLEDLCRRLYVPSFFDRLVRDRLDATFRTATVYCWLFQNITEGTAQRLHEQLEECDYYLGAMDVDFSHPLHLQFFRNSLIEKYRLTGRQCDIFYDMGHNEDPDVAEKDGFEKHGFRVDYEDQGARRTIFDNYDSLSHFKRVESFRSFCASLPGICDDDASDITHSLEELHPRLFDAFAAAARTLDRAETEEDYAQVALSGRRLLEQAADSLFPPRDGDWKGYKVGPSQNKNRLWAYLENALPRSDTLADRLSVLGAECDRLVELFNVGLHARSTRQNVELAFRDLIIWLSAVIKINPGMARDPYKPYGEEIVSFLQSALSRRET